LTCFSIAHVLRRKCEGEKKDIKKRQKKDAKKVTKRKEKRYQKSEKSKKGWILAKEREVKKKKLYKRM